MDVAFVPSATRDLEDVAAWWVANRPDAPGLVTHEISAAKERLAVDATTLPVFRRVGTLVVRRLHLPRTHRHVYDEVRADCVVVLAVWGSVRGILPKLRARLAESA